MLSLPIEFIEDVCLFLGRYGFADYRGNGVKLYPGWPSVGEAVDILRALANGYTLRAFSCRLRR